MNLFKLIIISIFVAVTLLPNTAHAAPSQLQKEAAAAFIQDYLPTSGLKGASVAIVDKGQIVLTQGFGQTATGRAITERTPMYIGSLSKAFTALGVMQLAEEGKINLDDPVIKYLPDFTMADPRARSIKVGQLLNHTSGMSDQSYPEMSARQPGTLEEAVRVLKDVSLADAPGAAYHYHNPNYHVAARLIEVVSGQSYDAYLKERIFVPLGMKNTHSVITTPVDTRIDGLEKGGNYLFGIFLPREESKRFLGGSHGIVSTAGDMAKWLQLFNDALARRDTLIAKNDTLRTMVEREYGWGKESFYAEPRVAHSGSTFTYSSQATLLPDRDTAIVVLTNSRAFLDIGYPLTESLVALAEGRDPQKGSRLALFGDLFIAGLTILAIGLGARGFIRAPLWAAKRRQAKWWRLLLRVIPYALSIIAIIFLPTLILLMGRNASWDWLWHMWPAFMILVVIFTCVVIAVLIRRAWCYWHLARKAK